MMTAKEKKAVYNKAYREANKEKIVALKKAWNNANRERKRIHSRTYYAANKDKVDKANKAWREANPEKANKYKEAWAAANTEKVARYRKAYAKANPDKANARCAKRRAAKLNATPAWADMEAIKSWYTLSKMFDKTFGEPHQVDHIVPLQGKDICGLHVEYNLQVLTATENRKKGNRI